MIQELCFRCEYNPNYDKGNALCSAVANMRKIALKMALLMPCYFLMKFYSEDLDFFFILPFTQNISVQLMPHLMGGGDIQEIQRRQYGGNNDDSSTNP